MKGVSLKFLRITSVALCLVLAACGGGGGGGASNATVNYTDGLGTSGLAPGTVVIGHDSFPQNIYPKYGKVAVALDDNDRALAVWVMHDSGSAAWNQSDSSGTWGTQQSLTQVSGITYQFSTIVLRMNVLGNAILGWVDSGATIAEHAARFIKGVGWDASFYDASGGSTGCGRVSEVLCKRILV